MRDPLSSVVREVDSSHEYGRGTPTSAMISVSVVKLDTTNYVERTRYDC